MDFNVSFLGTQFNPQQLVMSVGVPGSVSGIGIAPWRVTPENPLPTHALVTTLLRTETLLPASSGVLNPRAQRQLWLRWAWEGGHSPCLHFPHRPRKDPHKPKAAAAHHFGRGKQTLPHGPKLLPLACGTGGFHTSSFYCTDTFHILSTKRAQVISFFFTTLIGCLCPFCMDLYCLRHLTHPKPILVKGQRPESQTQAEPHYLREARMPPCSLGRK